LKEPQLSLRTAIYFYPLLKPLYEEEDKREEGEKSEHVAVDVRVGEEGEGEKSAQATPRE
jgi:hypothetical protein